MIQIQTGDHGNMVWSPHKVCNTITAKQWCNKGRTFIEQVPTFHITIALPDNNILLIDNILSIPPLSFYRIQVNTAVAGSTCQVVASSSTLAS